MLRHPGVERFVAGALGPTNRTASLSPDVNRPEYRNVTFRQLSEAYAEAASGLIEGGADLLMVETVFDTLNCKAALFGIAEVFEKWGNVCPSSSRAQLSMPVGGRFPDKPWRRSGTLSGTQTVCRRPELCAWALPKSGHGSRNCPRVPTVRSACTQTPGCPMNWASTTIRPEHGTVAGRVCRSGLINIVGGCCGTTPAHIQAIAQSVSEKAPRAIPRKTPGAACPAWNP